MKPKVLCQSISVSLLFIALAFATTTFIDVPVLSEVLLCSLLVVSIWVILVKGEKKTWAVLELAVTKRAVSSFCLAFLLTLIPLSLGAVLARYMFHQPPFQLRGEINWFGIGITLVMFFLEAFIKQGFPEELIFRGYLFYLLRKTYDPIKVMILSTVLLTVIHAIHLVKEGLVTGLVVMLYAFSFSCLASLLKQVFKTTWAAVAVHGGVHFINSSLLLLGFSETNLSISLQSLLMLGLSAYLYLNCYKKINEGEQYDCISRKIKSLENC